MIFQSSSLFLNLNLLQLKFPTFQLGEEQLQLTFEDVLQVCLAEDGATRVGWIGYNQTGCPLIDQAFHVLQVNLPTLFWLHMKHVRMRIQQ